MMPRKRFIASPTRSLSHLRKVTLYSDIFCFACGTSYKYVRVTPDGGVDMLVDGRPLSIRPGHGVGQRPVIGTCPKCGRTPGDARVLAIALSNRQSSVISTEDRDAWRKSFLAETQWLYDRIWGAGHE